MTCLFSAIPLYYIKHAVLNDPDIWWHMRAGEWMFQNHRIPHVDPFSTSTLGRQWVDYCWMFDAAVYWVVKQFDLVSIVWCQTIMRLAVTAALFSLLRSLTSFWKAVALTGLGMLAMAWSLPPRPGAFSVLFFVIELHVLVSAQRKSNLRLLWILPGLFLLWANIHIEFVNGLFVLGVFSIEPFLDRLFAGSRGPRTTLDAFRRQLLIVCGASFLAVLVNPYGIKLLTTMLELAGGGKIYDVILEFQAMFFRTINDWAVLSMLMLGCFALGRARAFRSAWGVLLAWSAWMGFRSLREVWLVTILSAVVAASYISEEEESPVEKRDTGMAMRLAVAAAVIVVLLAGASAWSLSSRGLLRQVTETYPVGAVNYIHRNHLQGPLLNEFSWGGFLIYALPEIPVSMDGRANVHTEEEIVRSLPLWNGEPGWENHPEVQRANLIISNHTWALASLLRSDPRFRVVYEDHTSVLFEAVHTEKTGAQAMSPSR
ncbi:MAG TPA: hypothetical protein VFI45_21590 [Candidatus Acidoferrum sp.]|nr:hypothetical protein [Candidatus Acidoferrum sp.]